MKQTKYPQLPQINLNNLARLLFETGIRRKGLNR